MALLLFQPQNHLGVMRIYKATEGTALLFKSTSLFNV